MTIAYVEYVANDAFHMHFRGNLTVQQLEDLGACILASLKAKGIDIATVLALADCAVECAGEYATKEFLDVLAPSAN